MYIKIWQKNESDYTWYVQIKCMIINRFSMIYNLSIITVSVHCMIDYIVDIPIILINNLRLFG